MCMCMSVSMSMSMSMPMSMPMSMSMPYMHARAYTSNGLRADDYLALWTNHQARPRPVSGGGADSARIYSSVPAAPNEAAAVSEAF